MDKIAIALTNDAALRVYAAVTTDMVKQAQGMHHSYPVATAAMGRALTAAAMMGAMQKHAGASITIQIKGDGPLGTVMAVSDAESNVRGYAANPDTELPLRADGKLDVGGGVGKQGFINVVKDSGSGEPYSGSVALVSGEIAEDLAEYFAASEQVPTAVGLGVLVGTNGVPEAAGGFIIQLMPGKGADDESLITRVEQTLKGLPSVTDMIRNGKDAEELVARLLSGIGYNVLETRDVAYLCNCSRERVERALISVGRTSLRSLIEEGKDTEINCSFCDKKYTVSPAELGELYEKSTRA